MYQVRSSKPQIVIEFFTETQLTQHWYLRQGGFVFIVVSLFVCLLAGLSRNYPVDFHKIGWNDGAWETEETFSVWW